MRIRSTFRILGQLSGQAVQLTKLLLVTASASGTVRARSRPIPCASAVAHYHPPALLWPAMSLNRALAFFHCLAFFHASLFPLPRVHQSASLVTERSRGRGGARDSPATTRHRHPRNLMTLCLDSSLMLPRFLESEG